MYVYHACMNTVNIVQLIIMNIHLMILAIAMRITVSDVASNDECKLGVL